MAKKQRNKRIDGWIRCADDNTKTFGIFFVTICTKDKNIRIIREAMYDPEIGWYYDGNNTAIIPIQPIAWRTYPEIYTGD